MKSVSNILAGEFLVDVQHICSTSDDDDVTQLQEYLLRGRGAILLKVLNTIGVQVFRCLFIKFIDKRQPYICVLCSTVFAVLRFQGLSSARELGDLLVSLLPLCCRFTASHDQNIQGKLLRCIFLQYCKWQLKCTKERKNLTIVI